MGETAPCERCGKESAPGQRFCGWCGAPLVASTPPGERRWVTVLFADLSGFTPASERMDPEDVREMVDPGLTRLAAIVEEHGGWVNRILGDAVLAVFGAPVAHEDDAERAVRAALQMQRCVAEQPSDFGGLELRVGVNTGEVMFATVGPDPTRDLTVMGDVANTASRLQTAAEPGQVLVGAETWTETRARFEYDAVAPLTVKGKTEPLTAWVASGTRGGPGGRALSGAPMIGRQAELELLASLWRRVGTEREPHLVTLLGPAGIGKSKLAAELAQLVIGGGGRAFRGASLPYGERVAYGAFAQLLKEVAGIYESDDRATAHRKLGDLAARLVPDDATLAGHLAVMLGLDTAEVDVEQRKLFDAARRLVEALAREKPTLFVLEDVQWADRSLLDLVEWLPRRVREAEAMFLTVARPELLDGRPGWAGGLTRYVALPLGPLATEETRALARLLLTGHRGADEIVTEVERVAGGNPLFVEELVSWAGGDDGGGRSFPTTVRAIIAARLDALPDAQRRLLLDAAVVGEVFWRGALLAGAEGDVDELIDDLEDRDLLRRRSVSRFQGEEEIAFKHLLIREVAYATLPKAARRDRHQVVAEYLERVSGGGSSAILAHHWSEAGDTERAIEHLLVAAEHAGRGWAKGEAVRLYDQALELVPEEDRSLRQRINVRRGVARQMLLHQVLEAGQLGGPPEGGTASS